MIKFPDINELGPLARLAPEVKYFYYMLLRECDSNGCTLYDPIGWAKRYCANDQPQARRLFAELKRLDLVRATPEYTLLAFYQEINKGSKRKPVLRHPQQTDLLDPAKGYALAPEIRRRADPQHLRLPFDEIKEAWNSTLAPLGAPTLHIMSQALKAKIKARALEDKACMESRWWADLFTHVRDHCPFLMGQTGTDWIISLDWLTRPSNLAKVINGNYDNRQPKVKPKGRTYGDG
jgi:hypothetical protein